MFELFKIGGEAWEYQLQGQRFKVKSPIRTKIVLNDEPVEKVSKFKYLSKLII
jgi:hypothetical protein